MSGDLGAAHARHAGSRAARFLETGARGAHLIAFAEAFFTKPNFSNYVLQACIQALPRFIETEKATRDFQGSVAGALQVYPRGVSLFCVGLGMLVFSLSGNAGKPHLVLLVLLSRAWSRSSRIAFHRHPCDARRGGVQGSRSCR